MILTFSSPPNSKLHVRSCIYCLIISSFLFQSYLLSSPFCFLSLLVVTQIRGHIAGSFPPLPTTVRALHFLSREDFSSFFPRRLGSNCAYPRKALSAVHPFLFIFANKFKISPRRDSNSWSNTSSIRGLPLVHRGDRLCTRLIVFCLVSWRCGSGL